MTHLIIPALVALVSGPAWGETWGDLVRRSLGWLQQRWNCERERHRNLQGRKEGQINLTPVMHDSPLPDPLSAFWLCMKDV
jgi:hypothetical protein